MRHSIEMLIEGDTAVATVVDLDTQQKKFIYPTRSVEDYEDGPKWTGRDEWLGDFWAKVRDTYDS